ncbi:hypothetical protein SAMN05216404_1221, partial [Nitrosospira multiformis]
DFDEKRNQRRVTDALNNLLKDAPNSKLKCAAGAFEALTISSYRLYRWYLARITATS